METQPKKQFAHLRSLRISDWQPAVERVEAKLKSRDGSIRSVPWSYPPGKEIGVTFEGEKEPRRFKLVDMHRTSGGKADVYIANYEEISGDQEESSGGNPAGKQNTLFDY